MTTVYLIRHGENDSLSKQIMPGRLPGIHLNAKGQAQAEALAAALKHEVRFAAVYSSPLERALETAAPLAAAQGLQVQPRPDLIETDVGEWAGRSLKRLRRTKAWRQLQEQPARFRFPGGESMLEQQARLVAEVEQLVGRHKAREAIACVGHADPIKLLVAHYLGMALDRFQRLVIAPASVSVLQFEPASVRLVSLNNCFAGV
jgi:probable phosphoglycerate mutase